MLKSQNTFHVCLFFQSVSHLLNKVTDYINKYDVESKYFNKLVRSCIHIGAKWTPLELNKIYRMFCNI